VPILPPEEDGQRLDRALRRLAPTLNFVGIQKLIRTGQVRVNGKRAKADSRLAAGDDIRLPPFATPATTGAPAAVPTWVSTALLHEDDYLMVLNKPQGIACQGGTGQKSSLDTLLKGWPSGSPRLVHRLDKETSGVLILAKSREMAADLADLFHNQRIEKTYLALTVLPPPKDKGQISAPLARGEEHRMVVADDGDAALTFYTLLGRKGRACLLEIEPKTGRTHQIRAHLAHIGAPIQGDPLYSEKPRWIEGCAPRLHLHAQKIRFIHPGTGEPLEIEAPLPGLFAASLAHLGIPAP
jgi:23S rRNA pseudouridine955/2504/2580 synthase